MDNTFKLYDPRENNPAPNIKIGDNNLAKNDYDNCSNNDIEDCITEENNNSEDEASTRPEIIDNKLNNMPYDR